MGVASPELMAGVYAERFNRHDAKGLLELYEPNAVLTFDGKKQFSGIGEIERVLAKMAAGNSTIRGRYLEVLVAGDTALARMEYELHDESGRAVSGGISNEVLRRSADGKWRFLIDDASGVSRGGS